MFQLETFIKKVKSDMLQTETFQFVGIQNDL